LKKNESFNSRYYQKRILRLFENQVLRSLFFVDNYIEQAMRDFYKFKRITSREYLLKARLPNSTPIQAEIPLVFGREKEREQILDIYEKIRVSSRVGGWIDLASTSPNLIGIKAAPGVGKTDFIQAFLADLVYRHESNFYVVAYQRRNDNGPLHPFMVLLYNALDYPGYCRAKENGFDMIGAIIEHYSQFIEPSDINSLERSLIYLYQKMEEHEKEPITLDEDKARQIEEFSLALQNLFNAYIKKVFSLEQSPFIFVFEDIHLYSKEAHLVLEFILKNFSLVKPALFILTYSYNYNANMLIKYKLNEIILNVFTHEQVAGFARQFTVHEGLPDEICYELYRKTCGHPYYISSYLKTWYSDLCHADGDTRIKFPENIQVLISGTLHYIPEYLLFILQITAVRGQSATLDEISFVLQKALKEPFDINITVTQIEKFNLIHILDDVISYKSPFYQAAIYETIISGNLVLFHKLYAEYMEQEFEQNRLQDSRLIVEQFMKCDNVDRAIPYLIYAIEHEMEEKNLKEARDLINYGLKQIAALPQIKRDIYKVKLYTVYAAILSTQKDSFKYEKLLKTIMDEYLPAIDDQSAETYLDLHLARKNFNDQEYKDAYELAESASNRFERQHDRIHMVESLLIAGRSLYHLKNAKHALSFFNRVQQHNPTLSQQVTLEFMRGKIYYEKYYLSRAVKQLVRSYTIARNVVQPVRLLSVARLLARSYLQLGDYKAARNILYTMLESANEENDFAMQFVANLFLGKVCMYLEDMEKAKKYLQQAVTLHGNRPSHILESYIEMISLNLRTNDIVQANMNYEKIEEHFNEDSLEILTVKGYILKSIILLREEQFADSAELVENALTVLRKTEISYEKEILFFRCSAIAAALEKNNTRLGVSSLDLYHKAFDFFKIMITKITEKEHKKIYREDHYYVKHILTKNLKMI
jgi:tetratricopeptide (TPR) repeat protein